MATRRRGTTGTTDHTARSSDTAGFGTGATKRLFRQDEGVAGWDPTTPMMPTTSSNAARPRTVAAGYDASSNILRVQFRSGSVYEYFDVEPRVWRNFQRVKSPGRAINRTLNFYDYREVSQEELMEEAATMDVDL